MAPSQRATAADQPAALTYAGLQLRIVAFILDILVLISFGMLFVATAVAYLLVDFYLNDENLSDHAPYVAATVLAMYVLAFPPLYHVLLWNWWGQTVGMMAVHIKVLSRGGRRVSLGRSALRLLGYSASMALFLGIAACIAVAIVVDIAIIVAIAIAAAVALAVVIARAVGIALFDRERRTLHDRLADTVVVELP